MRTGADYRESLRDGRRVWVAGRGPGRRRHDASGDPRDGRGICRLVRPALRSGMAGHRCLRRRPTTACARRSAYHRAAQRRRPDRAWAGASRATTFLSAGNITHTPAYGHLIALGVLTAVRPAQRLAGADRQRRGLSRSMIARTGRFLTFCGGARDRSAIACARTRPSAPRSRSCARPMPAW